MKIYISGAITGTTDYVSRFAKAKWLMFQRGYNPKQVISPIDICFDIPDGSKWETYMKKCIHHLAICDRIFMMKGWDKSRGAKEEKRIAEMLGLEIEYEECGD